MKSSGAARRDGDSRSRPMDNCDTMPTRHCHPPPGLAFGPSERGFCSSMKPMRMQGVALEPVLTVVAANIFDCGPFRAILKVYGSLFLAIIVVNTILYEWRLAALTPLLIFIIGPDGTSNNAMYLPLRGRLSPILADGPANRSIFTAQAGVGMSARAARAGTFRCPNRWCRRHASQYLHW
jgi:hypothetical protein